MSSSKKKNPTVFLDVSIGGDPLERIVIEVLQPHSLCLSFPCLKVSLSIAAFCSSCPQDCRELSCPLHRYPFNFLCVVFMSTWQDNNGLLSQVRQALARPLASLYISKDHLSIESSKDSWPKYLSLLLIHFLLCFSWTNQFITASLSFLFLQGGDFSNGNGILLTSYPLIILYIRSYVYFYVVCTSRP